MKTVFPGLVVSLLLLSQPVPAAAPPAPKAPQTAARSGSSPAPAVGESAVKGSSIGVAVSGSAVLDHAVGIKRISIANPDIAEAVAVSSTEIVINGKLAGDTSLIVWDQQGNRLQFEVHVTAGTAKLDVVRDELAREAGAGVSLSVQEGNVFLNGIVRDEIAADRAVSIASTLGKVINLLRVATPPGDAQILLKVRFADVDRSVSNQFGINLFTMDPVKGIATSTTGGFGSNPTFTLSQQSLNWNITNLLNIFYYRPDLNLGAVLQDLASRNLLEVLAEPNLLTLSGKAASFLAGGEFPFPTIQGGGSGVGQITIQFKEFGVRLNFLPTVTPRGTINLRVTPEVSALDYANGLSVSGYTVPGLSTRRVQTEVELEDGQSFVIAGLLNNQVTEQLSKMPGFASIPLFGKLFQSRTLNKSNTELLVMVTPEIVRPIPAGVRRPEVKGPVPFIKEGSPAAPQNPGAAVTGPPPAPLKRDTLPIEELKAAHRQSGGGPAPNLTPSLPALPLVLQPAAANSNAADASQPAFPQASPQ